MNFILQFITIQNGATLTRRDREEINIFVIFIFFAYKNILFASLIQIEHWWNDMRVSE